VEKNWKKSRAFPAVVMALGGSAGAAVHEGIVVFCVIIKTVAGAVFGAPSYTSSAANIPTTNACKASIASAKATISLRSATCFDLKNRKNVDPDSSALRS
jgi:hypothetical protein